MGEWKGIDRLAINVARESCAPDFALEILRNALLRELGPLLNAAEARLRDDSIGTSERLRKAVEQWK